MSYEDYEISNPMLTTVETSGLGRLSPQIRGIKEHKPRVTCWQPQMYYEIVP
jgi:hypothetical protein